MKIRDTDVAAVELMSLIRLHKDGTIILDSYTFSLLTGYFSYYVHEIIRDFYECGITCALQETTLKFERYAEMFRGVKFGKTDLEQFFVELVNWLDKTLEGPEIKKAFVDDFKRTFDEMFPELKEK